MLKKRGYAIAQCKWAIVEACDKELTALVQNPENYEKLTRPVCAFITFESDDGYIEALSYSKKMSWGFSGNKDPVMDGFEREQLLGGDPLFKAATEPTNIIWENRHIRGFNFCTRATSALLVVTLMLVVSFGFVYLFKKTSINASAQFPKVNCKELIETIGNNDTLKDLAGMEYEEYVDPENKGMVLNGPMQCFCQQ